MMSQRSFLQTFLGKLPPTWIVGSLFAYFIVVSFTFPLIGYFSGFAQDKLEVFAIPVVEEALKLLFVLYVSKRAFGAIVTFGVLELLLVKVPILAEFYGDDAFFPVAIASLIAFAFHVATALAYGKSASHNSKLAIFGACVVLHILFNSLSLFDLSDSIWSVSAIAICALVVASGWLIALASPQSNSA